MKVYHTKTDRELIESISKNDHQAYEFVFRKYYADLVRFSMKYVYKQEIAEEEVQNLFLYLWEKRETLSITTSLKSYLFTAAKNRSFNYLKSSYAKHETIVEEFRALNLFVQDNSESLIEQEELKDVLQKALDTLPPKCKTIFKLNRQSGLTYQEIAEHLEISKKTVEAQISIALKKLRQYLHTHWRQL